MSFSDLPPKNKSPEASIASKPIGTLSHSQLSFRSSIANRAYDNTRMRARSVLRERLWHDAQYGDTIPLTPELRQRMSGLYIMTGVALAGLVECNEEILQRRSASNEAKKVLGKSHIRIIGNRSQAMIEALCYREMQGTPEDHLLYLPATAAADKLEDKRDKHMGRDSSRLSLSYDGWLVRRAWKSGRTREATQVQIKTVDGVRRTPSTNVIKKRYEPHILVLVASLIAKPAAELLPVQQAIIDEVNAKATDEQVTKLDRANNRIFSALENHLHTYPQRLDSTIQ